MNKLSLAFAIFALAACGSSQSGDTTPTGDTTDTAAATTSPVTDEGWTLKDLKGQEVSLASYSGKTVVLEWFSPTCPFSVHAHEEGPLKDQPARVTADGDVAWLTINSTAGGKASELATNEQAAANWNILNPILMDSTGEVGKLYGAKTTPHMFILDGSGEVVYQGALDNAPRGDADGEYLNYIDAALSDIAAGNPVATAETKSYGCGVKY